MVIDLQHGQLIVKCIEFDGKNNDIKCHVMEESLDLRLSCSFLIDEDGREYAMDTFSKRKLTDGKEGYIQYCIEFTDQELELQPGTILTRGYEAWRKTIPNSDVAKLEYSSTHYEFMTGKIIDGIEISIEASGMVAISKPKSKLLRSTRSAVVKIETDEAKSLLSDMLRCVSEVDCYPINYYDDTSRLIIFYFEDGSTLNFGGVFAHEDVNTLDIINDFINSCSSINSYRIESDLEKNKVVNADENGDQSPEIKKLKLNDMLRDVVDSYNEAYTLLSDHGIKLLNQRERSVDLLINIENLVNSIASNPKTFYTDITDIQFKRQEFRDVCEFSQMELEAAKKSAAGVGAGVAGGAAVAAIAPNAAMWIATTFGTASTGTAISALSGAAAQSAALAWLGGGTLAASGGGMAAGSAFLALAGPVGWGIAGGSLLFSIVLFANNKLKLDKDKKKEIEAVLSNTEIIKEIDATVSSLLEKTDGIRENLSKQYTLCISNFGKNYMEIPEDMQIQLATLINNAKSLAFILNESVNGDVDECRENN